VTVPATRTLRDAVLARLALVANVKVYDGRIRQDDPPDTKPGTEGEVRPDRAAGGSSALSWSPQVTVVAGQPADCTAAVDRVRAELTDQPVTIPDGATGFLREVVDSGTVREDRTVVPSRFYVPLVYQTIATQ
jgi:hypothetical protein